MIKTKVAFLEGRFLLSQSEQFKKYCKSSDWLEKAGPPKSHYCFDHVSRLKITFDWLKKSLDRNPVPIEVIM